ncbi:HNH endonuclease signature motif containing protein [Kushneria konosiri]|nr:HNH endonuclease signature motif containing protein [Kushneria konosiri]
MAKPIPDQSTLLSILHYDPVTGSLTRKYSDSMSKAWNTRWAGRDATWKYKRVVGGDYECLTVSVLNSRYMAHRIIWMMMTGEQPPAEIDHVNRDATDNRWENLRKSDAQHNRRNLPRFSNNTSGYAGVVWSKAASKWRAQTKHKGKDHYLGLFEDKEDAAARVRDFWKEHGFDPGHGTAIDRASRGAIA